MVQNTERWYGQILQDIRLKKGFSQNSLAKRVGLCASYINRLESGERDTPSQEVHRALVHALRPSFEDGNLLAYAAGYLTPALNKVGPTDPTLHSVLRVLASALLSQEEKDAFSKNVQEMAEHWFLSRTGDAAPVTIGVTA